MDEEIRLSSSEFKALASEKRTGIIKLLKERNHTLTELSKKLKLAAPTVKQHLGILRDAELIQELEEGRKWKYYSLTRKGRNIFSAEAPVNVLIVLGVSIFALAGLMYSFLSVLGSQAMTVAQARAPATEALIAAADKTAAISEAASGNGAVYSAPLVPPEFLVAVMFLCIVALALLTGFCAAKLRK